MKKSIASEKALDIIGKNQDMKAFITEDFVECGAPSTVQKTIRNLISNGTLLRLGKGFFVRVKTNRFSKDPIPIDTVENLAIEAFSRLNIKATIGASRRDNILAVSTLIPGRTFINVGKSNTVRKFRIRSTEIFIERD